MTTECLNRSLNLYKMLDNDLFNDMTVEVFLHTMMLFTDADIIFDTFADMLDNHDSPFYFVEVREKLKVLNDRLQKEQR